MKLEQLKKYIQDEAKKKGLEEDRVFLIWYASTRAPGYTQSYTDKKDGGIDFVLEGKKEIILIQGKYGLSKRAQVREFSNTIKSWKDKESFNKWLKAEVKKPDAKQVFQRCFDERGSKRLVWEFVSLSDYNESTKEWEAMLKVGTEFETAVMYKHDVMFHFALDQIGAKYTAPLVVDVLEAGHLEHRYPNRNITTYCCVMKLGNLLKLLKDDKDAAELLFARNVRLKKEGSKVNEDIKNTYLHEIENFFLSNNGLHILCTEAKFGTGTVTIKHPAVINGGQTLRTLMYDVDETKKEGEILVRITELHQGVQIKGENAELIDNIICRSNSNNKMELWDLKSNDPIQVRIARELYHRGVYYERKEDEWSKVKANYPDIRLNVSKIDLAHAMAICDSAIGPAMWKRIGVRPFFTTGEGGYYDRIFKEAFSKIDETETKIRLYHIALKSAKGARKKMPEKFKTFPAAAKFYASGILWKALSSSGEYNDPLRIHYSRDSSLRKEIVGIVSDMFNFFEKDLTSGKIKQNDLFRTEGLWKEAKKEILTPKRKKKIIAALRKDVERSKKK